MAIEIPLAFDNIDFARAGVGFFVFLVLFGILQKAKILGKSKMINLLISLIIALYVMSNEAVSDFIISLSSNVAVVVIFALVFILVMAFANFSALSLFFMFILIMLFLVLTNVSPFYLVLDYVPSGIVKILIVICIFIVILSLAFGSKK